MQSQDYRGRGRKPRSSRLFLLGNDPKGNLTYMRHCFRKKNATIVKKKKERSKGEDAKRREAMNSTDMDQN